MTPVCSFTDVFLPLTASCQWRQVCKGIRQGKKGICVIAGDISPIDVISHMAYYCEEQGVAYM